MSLSTYCGTTHLSSICRELRRRKLLFYADTMVSHSIIRCWLIKTDLNHLKQYKLWTDREGTVLAHRTVRLRFRLMTIYLKQEFLVTAVQLLSLWWVDSRFEKAKIQCRNQKYEICEKSPRKQLIQANRGAATIEN